MNEKFFGLPEERQRSIISGALHVFAGCEYKKASMDGVAKAAGVSKALIFHYFGSKRELYLFLNDYATKFVIGQMSALHDYSRMDFFEILTDAQLCKIRILSVYPDIMLFITRTYFETEAEVRESLDREFGKIITDSGARFLARADARKFRDGVSAEAALNIVLWMADGFMRAQPPEKLQNLEALNAEFLSYMDLLRHQFYKAEYL